MSVFSTSIAPPVLREQCAVCSSGQVPFNLGALDTVKQEIEKCFKDNINVFASASNDGTNMPRTHPGKYNRVLCIHSATGRQLLEPQSDGGVERNAKRQL
ncbi:hypothetical protein DL768_010566 [Monosporascus sp. mg162]|nr:hypothetical protein DL768_010566 [Monosporascus sp. mg162]